MKRKYKKNLQKIRINPIVQLSKHYYRRSKHEVVKACALGSGVASPKIWEGAKIGVGQQNV